MYKRQRPVWPGIATTRIKSSEDPGRPASEITRQVALSRTIGRNWAGHAHWSVKSLMQNRDGISTALSKGAYSAPALVPPMPWVNRTAPQSPVVSMKGDSVHWQVEGVQKVAIQLFLNGRWVPYKVVPAYKGGMQLPRGTSAVAVRAVDRYGNTSVPVIGQ